MAMLTPKPHENLDRASELLYGIGGAESNVAVGLAAMGISSHWLSRVGADGFGERIINELQKNGVGVTGVELDRDRPTGLYVKVPGLDGESSAIYYRHGSAASAMNPAFLASPDASALLDGATLIHLSGITAALSRDCRTLLCALFDAPRNGRKISFDINWRAKLWASEDKSVLREFANRADVVLVGKDEAMEAFGTSDEKELRELLPSPAVVVIKNADISAIALMHDGQRIEVPALDVDVLEPVGAGDAFAAGYLGGLLIGLDQRLSLRRGHLSAASTLTVPGDRGPLPPAHILEAVLASSEEHWSETKVSSQGIESPALTEAQFALRSSKESS